MASLSVLHINDPKLIHGRIEGNFRGSLGLEVRNETQVGDHRTSAARRTDDSFGRARLGPDNGLGRPRTKQPAYVRIGRPHRSRRCAGVVSRDVT